jgi:hypothetical protein
MEPVQVHFTLCLRDQWSMWMQDKCIHIGYPHFYFMVTWTIFKKHLLEISLNWETIALQTLTTIGLLYIYHVWGPGWIEIHWNSIWLHTTHEGLWPHYMILEVSWDSLSTLSFGVRSVPISHFQKFLKTYFLIQKLYMMEVDWFYTHRA